MRFNTINRRHFRLALNTEFERVRRQPGLHSALLVIDLDHFKRVNDTWGHPVGDLVIKTLGHLLRQRLRRQDSIGRYGGEEFVAVLPQCSVEDAQTLLEDIRERFSNMEFVHGDAVGLVDAGAAEAIVTRKTSLLPVGVTTVRGNFARPPWRK